MGANNLNPDTEQLEDTLFAKPKEITLWSYGNALETLRQADGTKKITSILYADAGDTFQKLDSFLGKLGQPYGVAAYKPYHSSGEMYLHNYIGMIGVPMEFLTAFCRGARDGLSGRIGKSRILDPARQIWKHLNADKTVIITSGLLKALEGKGIEKVVEVQVMAKVTALGCALSAIVAAFAAGAPDAFLATVAAVGVYGVAGEKAAETALRPGSFRVAFIDALEAVSAPEVATRMRAR